MQNKTNTLWRALGAMALSGALMLVAGCHSSAQNTGPDPATANMAPANGQTQVMGENAAYSPQQQGESYPQQQPAPIQQAYPQQASPQQQGYYPSDAEQAGEEALEEADQPPPPLPEYDQPEAPGPDYMWTPGYWAWGPNGYYWVPGAWVEAPYYGALWTPPWWGYCGVRYCWHHGYWGPHVGYYGGIDYGFGYIGIGYFGGYWSGNHFYYNRAVTHVGGGIRNVYSRPVMYNNVRYGAQPSNRVSYNGGRGGLNVRPRPTEIAAGRERHEAAMPVQRQARTEAAQNRGQAFTANHGRPAEAAAARGFANSRFANSRGVAPTPRGVEPGRPGMNAPAGARPNAAPNRIENRPGQPQPNAAPNRIENRPGQPQPNAAPNRFENRPGQPRPNAAPNRPQPQPRIENRPQAQPQQRMETRPQPQQRMENRPQPQQRMENRPQPQQRMQAPRPQPQQRAAPQARPAPVPRAAPAPHPQAAPRGGGGGGHPQGGGGHPDNGDHGHR